MYVPSEFKEDDPARLAAVMAENSFGILVTTDDEAAPFATHIPFIFEAERQVLVGHVARANPQWRHLESGKEALAIFSGPHAYISPSWYDVRPSVPTWNYVAVHVYGKARLLEQPAQARAVLRQLVDRYEASFEKPWPMELPPEYEAGMLRGIVAFEIQITRMEGKFKLSQNRSAADREGVTGNLEQLADRDSAAVARLMRL